MINHRRPILVTGSIRSGTTWIGRMIASSPNVAYIHEPFSPFVRSGINPYKPNNWFLYICNENAGDYIRTMNDILNFKYSFCSEFVSIKSIKDIGRMLRDSSSFMKYRIRKLLPLIKDPIAIFSVEWLVANYNFIPIILIRHPAAVITSMLIRKYDINFKHFVDQPLLMDDYLSPFKDKIIEYSKRKKSILENAILYWNCVHYVILVYKQKYPNWLFIRHKDIAKNPVEGFANLFNWLGLEYSKSIKQLVLDYSNEDNPGKPNDPSQWNDFKRNSRITTNYWKSYLNKEDIKKIRESTRNISLSFYNDADWEVI